MRLPRDVGGDELASLLSRYGYSITRQTGSHLRLTSSLRGMEHHVTIPHHKPLKVGTLSGILKDVAAYLDMDKQELIEELFKG
jgi:predicted RNA binding protein YcfA (HicA-like mRNA interferase family)